jgi:hypothetical protein
MSLGIELQQRIGLGMVDRNQWNEAEQRISRKQKR